MEQKTKLLNKYLELNEQKNKIQIELDLIKLQFEEILTEENDTAFSTENGEVRLMSQKRKIFSKDRAIPFIPVSELASCYDEKEIQFIRIISSATKDIINNITKK